MDRIENTEHLEELLSEPTEQVIDTLAHLEGDLMLLGVAGKMGPTYAAWPTSLGPRRRLRRIIGVARFSRLPGAGCKPGASRRFAAISWTRPSWPTCPMCPTSFTWRE